MKILDIYILKRFLTSFFFVVMLILAISVMIDVTEKNEDFIGSDVTFKQIVFDYYFNFMPYIGNLLSPLFIFIAAVFVTARMAAHTEIIAILSSGISFLRFLVPYLIGSILIAILTFYLIGWVIPKSNKAMIAFENTYIKEKYYYDARDVHTKIAPNTYAYLESYNVQIHTGYQFTLEYIEGTQLKSKLKSARILWNPKKKKWTLEDYLIRNFEPGHKQKIIHGNTLDTTINLSPKDFESKYLYQETLNLPELENYIQTLTERGSESVEIYQIEKYERYAYPFSLILLTVFGVIVSARKTRGGTGFQIAFGFILAFIYLIFVVMSRGLASAGGIGPMLAAWIPNIVFTFIGIVMYKTLPR